jgi:hypothetical protein
MKNIHFESLFQKERENPQVNEDNEFVYISEDFAEIICKFGTAHFDEINGLSEPEINIFYTSFVDIVFSNEEYKLLVCCRFFDSGSTSYFGWNKVEKNDEIKGIIPINTLDENLIEWMKKNLIIK